MALVTGVPQAVQLDALAVGKVSKLVELRLQKRSLLAKDGFLSKIKLKASRTCKLATIPRTGGRTPTLSQVGKCSSLMRPIMHSRQAVSFACIGHRKHIALQLDVEVVATGGQLIHVHSSDRVVRKAYIGITVLYFAKGARILRDHICLAT